MLCQSQGLGLIPLSIHDIRYKGYTNRPHVSNLAIKLSSMGLNICKIILVILYEQCLRGSHWPITVFALVKWNIQQFCENIHPSTTISHQNGIRIDIRYIYYG